MTSGFEIPEQIPAGDYPATLEAIEDKTSRDNAPFKLWRFMALTPEGPKDVTRASSTKGGSKSNAFKWATVLLGRPPTADEMTSPDVLLGRPCRLVVAVNPETGYSDVEAILPSHRPLSKATEAAYAEQADAEEQPPLPEPSNDPESY